MRLKALSIVLFTAALLAAGCGQTDYREVPQYTIEQFLNKVSIYGASLSHDESKILLTTDKSGVFNLYTIGVEGGEMARVTFSDSSAVFSAGFFPHDDRILFTSDQAGNEINHLYRLDEDGTVTDLTPYEGARSTFLGWLYDDESFLFSSNRRDQRFMDIYEVDGETFVTEMIYQNDSGYYLGDVSNDERYIAFSKYITEHNIDIYLYDRETEELKHISPHEGDVVYQPATFSVDGKSLYYLTNESSEFMYLVRYDLESGKREKVAESPWDILYAYFSRSGKYRVIFINNDARTEIQVLNTETGQPVTLPKLPDADISSVRISDSEKLMTFYVNGSRSPNNLYVLNLETMEYKKLTESMTPEIDTDNLVDAQVVRYKSFDGIEIPALLYKPHHIKPGEQAPAIVSVHGGPGGQARVGYASDIQYLVNHGYVVIDVNNRGSSGYGKTFFKLDDMRHGEDDLLDCVYAKNFMASLGYVDTSRVAIYGASYGGYMVLAALTFQPEEFAAGVDMFGISNWVRTLESIPPWWESFRQALYEEMGDPKTDREYLESISPLFHAERIVKPLMVLQGANDPRVIQPESDDIVAAVRNNDVPVEYMIFVDEGHGFLKKDNRIKGFKAVLDFLDTHLKETPEI
ncbi:MAG: prolyl oligopeptidase family serine peptidase [Candidatus Zixiibacteriota bacterium]|nr:MAG: prolyl oligopeptidase family serine peptidase [candidate division Zixibacteria bacterium]